MNHTIKKAFTLIELLVVIAIIGILSGLIIVGMSSSVNSANIAKAQIFSSSLRDSLLANLVSELKFDELSSATNGATLQDSWSNGNFVTLITGDASDKIRNGSSCLYNKCLYFDGSNDYLSGTLATPIANRSFTISGWIYENDSAVNRVWLSVGSVSSPNNLIHLRVRSDGYMRFAFYSNDLDTPAPVFVAKQWNNVVYTYDSSALSRAIYYNGVKVASSTGTAAYIGTDSFTVSSFMAIQEYWYGLIDDVKIYSTAIPSSKIKEMYYSGINNLLAKRQLGIADYENKIKEL